LIVAIEHLKKTEKDDHISEDDRKHAETDVQKLTDKHIKDIDDLIALKEKEIMEV
jgi:ribosome recycling factor